MFLSQPDPGTNTPPRSTAIAFPRATAADQPAREGTAPPPTTRLLPEPSLNRTVIPHWSSFRIQNVEPLWGRGQMLEEGQVLRRPLLSPPGKQIGPVRATCSFLPTYHHHQQSVAISGDPDNHSEVRGNQLRPDAGCDVGPSGVPTTIGQHNTPDRRSAPTSGDGPCLDL